MNFKVNNKKIRVDNVDLGGIGNASLFLIGDADLITSSSIFDTPASSLIYSKKVPILPEQPKEIEEQKLFQED